MDHFIVWSNEDFLISTDRQRLDETAIHAFLTKSTWAAGISRQLVSRSIVNSMCFGLYKSGAQIGFARVITDFATFGYLADVYVLEAFRGQGLGRRLVVAVMSHPQLQGFRRWLLATSTAPWLYEKLGWGHPDNPGLFMEVFAPDVYGAWKGEVYASQSN